jgi:5'-3' exonuclease
VIVEVLAAAGIPRLGAPGHEADDVIGTLAARHAGPQGNGAEVEVVTSDRDLFQLVDDTRRIRVLNVSRGVRNLEVVDQAWLYRRYGVGTGAAYAALATLRGDPSDGLPGVPGIGEKSAAALLARFGSLDGLLDAVDDPASALTAGQRARLGAGRAYLAAAASVVPVVGDAPVDDVVDRFPAAPADPERLRALADRWGLASSVTRLGQACGWS